MEICNGPCLDPRGIEQKQIQPLLICYTKKQKARLASLGNAEHALDSMAYSTPKRAIRLYRRRDTVVLNNEEALDRGPTYVSIVLSEVYCEVT